MTTFSDLNIKKPLLNALAELGMEHPTSIQEKVFSPIMAGKDVLGIAQTGTGKTLAFLLPTLCQWSFSKERFAQMLIVVPTRELVVQIVEEIDKLTKYMSVTTVGVYGGANINTQDATVSKGLDILVATPGRLLDLALRGSLPLKGIKKFIIDEVDEMLNLGFRTQLTNILDILPKKRQNLLFSATLLEEVENLIDTFFTQPERVEAAPAGTPLTNIQQIVYQVPNFYTKLNFLEHLLTTDEDMTKVLVFAESKSLADAIFEHLEPIFGEEIGVIHSNKAQNNRFQTVENFKEGNTRILIATDIISRGIDIMEVSHVINFDMPEVPETHIHRIGRTGRADKKGIALSFVTPKEKPRKAAIEAFMAKKMKPVKMPVEVEVSTEIAPHEIELVLMPNIKTKASTIERGASFHEKKAKNKKVNNKIRVKEKMHAKYGKPKTRGDKHAKPPR